MRSMTPRLDAGVSFHSRASVPAVNFSHRWQASVIKRTIYGALQRTKLHVTVVSTDMPKTSPVSEKAIVLVPKL
jgi:hypothetical protein